MILNPKPPSLEAKDPNSTTPDACASTTTVARTVRGFGFRAYFDPIKRFYVYTSVLYGPFQGSRAV